MSVNRAGTNTVNICGSRITIPDIYHPLKSMPSDPENSLAYGMQSEAAKSFIMLYPTPVNRMMPVDIGQISKEIHQCLEEDQGLIDIRIVHDSEGRECIYTIVKTLQKPSGVQYNLTLQINYPDQPLHVQGYFEENGTTGMRDAVVLSNVMSQNLVAADTMSGWAQDPFDSEYTKGVLKNLSEDEKYDAAFPNHPLSELRKFVNGLLKIETEQNETRDVPDIEGNWQPRKYCLSVYKPVWK